MTTLLAHDERGSGPAIVLIHGHPFSRRMWGGQLDALSDRFRVVAPTCPATASRRPAARPSPRASSRTPSSS